MTDEYEPTPEEIAAYVERMLTSLEETTAAAPALEGLTARLRLARLAAARSPPCGASGSLPPAAVAAEIAGELASLAASAERSALAMLAYSIGIAHEEAEARAHALSVSP